MLNELSPLVENFTGDSPRILVVEDDQDTSEMLVDFLQHSLSAETSVAQSAQEAIDLDAENPAEIILLDYLLPDTDGLELINALGGSNQRPIILMTGHPTLGRAIEAMRLGAADMFVKPFDLDKMGSTIIDSLVRYRKEQLRIKRLNRIREMSRRVIQDRRALRRKMDMLCKDLVGAYRELADKVNKLDKKNLSD